MSTDYSEDYQSPLDSSNLEMDIPINYTEILDEISMDYHAGFMDYIDGITQLKSISNTLDSRNTWNHPLVQEIVSVAETNSISDIVNKFDMQGEKSLDSIINDYSGELYSRFLRYGDFAISLQATVAEIERVLKCNVSLEDYKAIMESIKNDPKVNSLIAFVEKDPTLKRVATGVLFKYGGMPVTVNIPAMSEWTLETFSAASIKEWYVKFYGGGKGLADSPLVSKSVATKGLLGGLVQLGILTIKDYNKGTLDAEHMTVNVSRALATYGATCAGCAVASHLASSATFGLAAGPIGAGVALGLSVIGSAVIDELYKAYRYNEVPNPNEYQDISSADIKAALEKNGVLVHAPSFFEGESIYDTMAHIPGSVIDDNVFNYVTQSAVPGVSMMEQDSYKKCDIISELFNDEIVYHGLAFDDDGSIMNFWTEDKFVEEIKFHNSIDMDSEEEAFARSLFRFFKEGKDSNDPRITTIWNHCFFSGWD